MRSVVYSQLPSVQRLLEFESDVDDCGIRIMQSELQQAIANIGILLAHGDSVSNFEDRARQVLTCCADVYTQFERIIKEQDALLNE